MSNWDYFPQVMLPPKFNIFDPEVRIPAYARPRDTDPGINSGTPDLSGVPMASPMIPIDQNPEHGWGPNENTQQFWRDTILSGKLPSDLNKMVPPTSEVPVFDWQNRPGNPPPQTYTWNDFPEIQTNKTT